MISDTDRLKSVLVSKLYEIEDLKKQLEQRDRPRGEQKTRLTEEQRYRERGDELGTFTKAGPFSQIGDGYDPNIEVEVYEAGQNATTSAALECNATTSAGPSGEEV